MLSTLPAPKSDFIGLDNKIHLASGGEPPMLVNHRKAFEDFANDKSGGMEGYERHWAKVDQVREQVASIIGLSSIDIGLIGNTSEGIMRVVASIPWSQQDNVVVSEIDYTSGRYAFGNLSKLGVDVRVVPAKNWRIDCSELLNFCDDRTRAVYISQVNALTGQYVDITLLSQKFKDRDIVLLLDASHALGVAPVQASLANFTVSACYKFVLGIHEGIFAWNQRLQPDFEPMGVGWSAAIPGEKPEQFSYKAGAQRAEYGNAGHLGAYLLYESLAYLEQFNRQEIYNHVRAGTERLINGFEKNSLDIMTPRDSQEIAGNATFLYPNPRTLVDKAAKENIYVWGDNGRIRVSTHIFTTDDDIDYFLDRLPSYLT